MWTVVGVLSSAAPPGKKRKKVWTGLKIGIQMKWKKVTKTFVMTSDWKTALIPRFIWKYLRVVRVQTPEKDLESDQYRRCETTRWCWCKVRLPARNYQSQRAAWTINGPLHIWFPPTSQAVPGLKWHDGTHSCQLTPGTHLIAPSGMFTLGTFCSFPSKHRYF